MGGGDGLLSRVHMFKSKKERDEKKTERRLEKGEDRAKKFEKGEKYHKAFAAYQELSRTAWSTRDKRAVDYCLDAVKCGLKTGDDFKAGWSYKCAASRSLSLGDAHNAINFSKKAIKHFKKSNSYYAAQWCYNIMGRAAEKLGDERLALESYEKSVEIGRSEDIERRISELRNKIKK